MHFETFLKLQEIKLQRMRKMHRRIITQTLIFFILFISLIVFLSISKLSACEKVIEIIDGDTFKTQNDTIRVLGIDAFDKKLKIAVKQAEFTNKSVIDVIELRERGKSFAMQYLLNQCIDLKDDYKKRDIYNRRLAYVFIDGVDYSSLILQNELAMVYCSDKKIANFKKYQQLSKWKCK